ncbi:HAD family phosphatase [Streptomyces sp. WMMB303]|uniref:HAD family hydrolase n=1 Tax=Streptomyces sp. WMMB303 TaxID=3034154 RepID=UPI0023EACCF7|nr:HAD family phosphatase [Streptomyces sp. WMMB303]MDF4252049.1 HAD family phosphatase [Streptomyces sp. WMMB303]
MISSAAAPAVVFDLDGTLVDSEPHYYEAGRRLLAAHGVPGFSWAEHARFIGIGTRETLAALRREHGLTASVDTLLAEKNRLYLQSVRSGPEVFPEMRKLVEHLHAGGHPLAVASGSSRGAIDAVLGATSLDELLPLRVSAEEVPHGKPRPDVFLEAARRLGVSPADCVAVEDAPAGAEAARRAGMRCVALPYLAEQAADPGFAGAGLLFPGGQRACDAQQIYDWMTGRPAADPPPSGGPQRA